MKIEVWSIGKCSQKYLVEGLELYTKKIKFYNTFEYIEWPETKSMRTADKSSSLKIQYEFILSKLHKEDQLILLDDKGKDFTSITFAHYLNKLMVSGNKKYVFLIGGAFGFHEELYKKAKDKISLSKLTFSHDMVRLILLEQIYRGFTILRNEPYHHE